MFEIHELVFEDDDNFPVMLERDYTLNGFLKRNWFASTMNDVLPREQFEDNEHRLEAIYALEDVSKKADIEKAPDFYMVDLGIYALAEKYWDWIPAWQAAGCRVAENVIPAGTRRFKLLFPTAVVDMVDMKHTRIRPNTNAPTDRERRPITAIFEPQEKPPYIFRMIIREEDFGGARISGDCFVNSTFRMDCERLGIESCQFAQVLQFSRSS